MEDIKVSGFLEKKNGSEKQTVQFYRRNLLEYNHQEHADGDMGVTVTAKVYIFKKYEILESASRMRQMRNAHKISMGH
jgi:hypothetical protein